MNQRIGEKVRGTMRKEGATLPESLPVEPPISEVRKRVAGFETTVANLPKPAENQG